METAKKDPKATIGLNVELPPELHYRVKVWAALRRKSIKAAVIELLERECPPVPPPADGEG